MERTNSAHELVLESLTQALLLLMDEKPLREIRISELCDRAGTSRISFYRNFKSLEDILVQHLNRCTDLWWAQESQKPADLLREDFLPSLIAEYRKNEHLIRLLYENQVSYLIKDHLFACCAPETGLDETDSYRRALLAGALYGLVDEWIRRGMGDYPAHATLYKLLNTPSV